MRINRVKKLPVVLEAEEVHKLLSIPNTRYLTSLRNKAIISLMANCGLRVSEVVNLRPGDLNITKNKIKVVNGKGGKDREILSINPDTINLLKEWKKRKPKSENFFCTIRENQSGKNLKFNSRRGSRLSVRTIQSTVKNYARKAGIDKEISPHTLRHTFATEYYRQSKDLETLRMILGHTSITVTQIYVTLANMDIEAGMKKFIGFS